MQFFDDVRVLGARRIEPIDNLCVGAVVSYGNGHRREQERIVQINYRQGWTGGLSVRLESGELLPARNVRVEHASSDPFAIAPGRTFTLGIQQGGLWSFLEEFFEPMVGSIAEERTAIVLAAQGNRRNSAVYFSIEGKGIYSLSLETVAGKLHFQGR